MGLIPIPGKYYEVMNALLYSLTLLQRVTHQRVMNLLITRDIEKIISVRFIITREYLRTFCLY